MFGREPRFPLETEKDGDGTDMSDVQKQCQDCDGEQVIDKIIEKQTSLFREVEQRICSDVAVEPHLHPLSGESLQWRTANSDDEA